MSAIDDILSGKDRYFYDCDCEKCQSFGEEITALRSYAEQISSFIEPHFKGATGRFMNVQEIGEWIRQIGHDLDELIDVNDALKKSVQKIIQNTGWCPCCDSDHGHTETCPMRDERPI